MTTLIVSCDGAARGNPGPAGAGSQLTTPDGEVVAEVAEGLGEATNNVAEYTAVILGLERAKELGATEVLLRSDSQLLINQLTGIYRVKTPHLQPLHRRVRQGSQLCDELVNPGTDSAFAFAQNVIKPEGIPLEKSFEILRRRRDVMKAEKLANEPHICAPSKLQALETVHRVELGGENFRERLHTRATGAD